MPKQRIRVASIEDFKKRATIKFPLGTNAEGFVIAVNDRFFAYENRCQHMPLPLDYGDGGFLSPDGKRILCRNHGAEYDPATGLCTQGPCAGRSLNSFPVVVEKGEVWVEIKTGS